MKVLFLDIDGVLNGHEKHPDSPYTTIRPDCVQRLNQVLKATGCQLVISSAWRYMLLPVRGKRPPMTCRGFQYMMHTHGLIFHAHGCEIIGHTAADEECCRCSRKGQNTIGQDGSHSCRYCGEEQTRGKQIKDWVRCRDGIDRYAVVDDDDLGIRAEGLPFVQTDGTKGLQDKDTRKLIRLLR